MKKDNLEHTDISSNKIERNGFEQEDASYRLGEEIKNKTYAFFHDFAQRNYDGKSKPREADIDEHFLADIEYLDANTDLQPSVISNTEKRDLSKEEFQQIYENDPGYVNGNVLDYDNESASESNTYKETGLHSGAIHWGNYAIKDSAEYITLDAGKLLSRWGNEKGTFMSDVGVDYDSLELPIVKEKNEQNIYEVLKPFPVEISNVNKQPWNNSDEAKKQGEFENTIQYRTPIPVDELVKEGYLIKLDENKKV